MIRYAFPIQNIEELATLIGISVKELWYLRIERTSLIAIGKNKRLLVKAFEISLPYSPAERSATKIA